MTSHDRISRTLADRLRRGLLAALALAGVGAIAYVVLDRQPRARLWPENSAASGGGAPSAAPAARPAGDRERVPASAPGTAAASFPLYLDATRRDPGSAPAIEMPPGAQTVTILLEPVVPRAAEAGEPLRIEIHDDAGRVVWSTMTTVGAVRDRRGPAGRLLTLSVPASVIPPGAYTLSLGRLGEGTGESLMEATFEVRGRAS